MSGRSGNKKSDADHEEDDSSGGDSSNFAPNRERLNENSFFCRLDSAPAIKDYLKGGLCVRFSGISTAQFASSELGDGVAVQCLDVDLWALRKYLYPGKPVVTATSLKRVQDLEDEGFRQIDEVVPWFQITLTPDPAGSSYLYRHFGDESLPPDSRLPRSPE